MQNKVDLTINRFKMLNHGEAVLVALSGGADSVALVLILKELGYDVSACHINHNLRGDESKRDENFCKGFCNANSIKLLVENIDVITYCKNNKLSIEEGARNLRYKIFEKYADGKKIATAHSLSDSFETTLFNLIRGTSLKGLCGIPPVRDNIIRPLIECTRAEIEKFLQEKNQDYVTDSTNLTTEYSRNKIRLDVVPTLEKINSAFFRNYHKTITSLYYDSLYLDNKSQIHLKNARNTDGSYRIDELLKENTAILSRTIAAILFENDVEVSNDRVFATIAILEQGGKINIKSDVYAIANKSTLTIKQIKKTSTAFEFELKADEEYLIGDRVFSASSTDVFENFIDNVNKKFANEMVDCDKINGKAFVRSRRDGDRIKFCGREHTTSIKKLFNRDVLAENRDDVIFLADDDGIFFVEGYGIAKRVCCDEATRKILNINIVKR